LVTDNRCGAALRDRRLGLCSGTTSAASSATSAAAAPASAADPPSSTTSSADGAASWTNAVIGPSAARRLWLTLLPASTPGSEWAGGGGGSGVPLAGTAPSAVTAASARVDSTAVSGRRITGLISPEEPHR